VAEVPAASPRAFRYAACYLIGVALPLATLAFELLTHVSLELYFDPIPSWLHLLLVAGVPAAVLLAGRQLRLGGRARAGVAAAGFAAGISLVYTVLYLPILPLSAIAVLWFGIGLLPFAPVGGLVASLLIGLPLARQLPSGTRIFAAAAGGAVLVLALLDLPGWIVARGLDTESVALLEGWGSRGAMLRAAHRGTGQANLSAHLWYGTELFGDWRGVDEDLRRNRLLFYRATGEDAASLPAPRLPGVPEARLFGQPRSRVWRDRAEGAAAPGLSLSSSRVDVAAFADEAVAYLEWTLVFQNDAAFDQEATARLMLPPGGVVTRANLWIDGELREAAFGPRAQVREAYESVVRRRRDPLLVTSDRPGEASIRAFPVPPNGKTMRVRVGVSVPLTLTAPERAALLLPGLAEHNFEVASSLGHSLWVDSRTPILEAPAPLEISSSGAASTLRGSLPLGEDAVALVFARTPAEPALWVADTLAETPGFIRQRVAPRPAREERWVVVVDASRGAARQRERIADALAGFPAERLAGIVVASSEPLWLLDGAGGGPAKALDRLRDVPFRGGRDNQPALEAAFDRALDEGASVLWLCAGQPLLLGAPDTLVQRLERRPDVEVVVVPLATARNALLDALPARSLIEVQRASSPEEALALLAGAGPASSMLVRERIASAPAGARVLEPDHPVAVHLARLWASDEVQRSLARDGAAEGSGPAGLAARYGVVTPLSGAVVLEQAAQYRAAGLEVPEGSDVDMPPVPEPSAFLLFALGLALVEARRRRSAVGPRRPAS
jgi:hypothetical protein